MSKKTTARGAASSGFTLIELLLATVGLAVIMLSVFTLFSGGVKNWTTMEPQLNMRQETTDALYGKAGDKSGGMVGNIQSARLLLDGIAAGTTTAYAYAINLNHGTISSSVLYFINTDKQQVGTNTPPGTFSSTEDDVVCYYAMADSVGSYSSWSLKRDVYNPMAGTKSTQVVLKELGNPTRTGTGSYRIFTYYDRSGNAIDPANIVASITAKGIAYIKIDIQRDIDTDGDHRWGEDPVDGKDNDGDTRIDEDKPMDLSLQTKIFPRMLWKDKPQQ